MADSDKRTDPRTVFVRGIDSAVGSEQLQEFFSEIGPVKNAFLVRKGKDGPHRGFGFVQFALQEDATRAAAELHGKELAGRKLKVEVAVKRAPLEERKKRKQEAAAAPEQQQQQQGKPAADASERPPAAKKPRPAKTASKPSGAAAAASGKHKWLRTVAVGGLVPEAVESAVQMAKQAGEVEEVIRPVPDHLAAQCLLRRDGCSGESFLAVYKSVREAIAAVAKLHGQAAGSSGNDVGKKGGKKATAADAAAGGVCRVWARQLSGEGLHQKRWRLVVRNLPFTTTEEQLREAFSPAGFVWELTLPRSAGGRGRGFAFVGFTCRAHAERGIKLVNGQTVAGRPVAVDWAVAKAQYGSNKEAEGDGGAATGNTSGSARQQMGIDGMDSESEDEQGSQPAQLGHEEEGGEVDGLEPEQERRMLASVIDGILEDSDADEGGSAGPRSDEEGEQEEEDDDEEDEDEEGGSSTDGEQEGKDEQEKEAEEGKEAEQQQTGAGGAAAADPFSKGQLQKKAAAVGAAAGGDQGRQRGEAEEGATVFIRGLPLDVAKEQVFLKMKAFGPVRSCRLVVDKLSGKLKGTAFVDFYKRASAQAAADACAKGRRKEGPGVVIAGRVADVDLAVGQDDARALSAAKAAERGSHSRRLVLAKEGQIVEGSPAWEDMSAGDRAKRKRAAEEKKLKLKSPNFVVSNTRLSVRNIPLSWTEKQLKQAFIAAVKQRANKAQPHVKQVKILVDEERQGADGTPRSKGIGFVEFSEHEHALCALRQLNNNPTTFTKDRRPIVEFALENVKALKLREAKLSKSKQVHGPQQQQQTQQDGAAQGPAAVPVAHGSSKAQQQDQGERGDAEPAAPKSKRQLRKERRLMLKERKKQQKQVQAEGDKAAAAAANGANEANDKSRSAKRRELRKRKQAGQGAPAAVPGVAAAGAAATKPALPVALGKPAKSAPGSKQQAATERKQQVNSRAAKVAAAAQQEQLARQRKRSADELIDKLAEGPAGELRARKQRKREQTDNVDKLAKQYLSKYFVDAPSPKKNKGVAGGSSKATGAASQRAAMKRWFE